jgi:hypothetical protein
VAAVKPGERQIVITLTNAEANELWSVATKVLNDPDANEAWGMTTRQWKSFYVAVAKLGSHVSAARLNAERRKSGWREGKCGHLVPPSEWRAGWRTCEFCPDKNLVTS